MTEPGAGTQISAEVSGKSAKASARLWTAYEAAAATGGALCARGGDTERWFGEEWAATGISIDTRTLAPGDLFVALQDARDGHDFVLSAYGRGASAVLVSRAPVETPPDAPFLLVGDTMEGLVDLAKAARMRNFGKRIAVTGSAGKTSTKEMLALMLRGQGKTHAAVKSLNNHIGVPLTLARLPMDADYSIYEIGMNHADEITPLTQLVAPHVAIITTVAEAHIENLGSMAAIARAKAEILCGVRRGGACVLPIDNPHFSILHEEARRVGVERIITFGEAAGADLRLTQYASDGRRADVEAEIFGARCAFTLGAPGKHMATNALAALGAVSAIGGDEAAAAAALAQFDAGGGRGAQLDLQLKGGVRVRVLDESYNANPSSMRAAISILSSLSPFAGGRRIAVLGDMLELGGQAPALHAGLAEPLINARVDTVYGAGPLTAHLMAALPEKMRGAHVDAAHDLAQAVIADLKDGDIIMVKGSNSSKVAMLVEALRAASVPESDDVAQKAQVKGPS